MCAKTMCDWLLVEAHGVFFCVVEALFLAAQDALELRNVCTFVYAVFG
jgi:hypothetical protein